MSQTSKKLTKTILYLLVAAGVASAYYFIIRGNTHELVDVAANIKWLYILGSSAMYLIYLLLLGAIWKVLLGHYKQSISWRGAIDINNISQPTKYIPGTFWTYIARFFIGKNFGLSKSAILYSSASEFVYFIMSCAIWALFILLLILPSSFYAVLIALACLLLIIFHIPIMQKLVILFSKIRRKKYSLPENISYIESLSLILLYVIAWGIGGFSFYLAYLAFGNQALDTVGVVKFISIFAASNIAGYAVAIIPAGLGIKELVQTALIATGGIAATAIASITLVHRIITIIIDLLTCLVSYGDVTLLQLLKGGMRAAEDELDIKKQ